MTYKEFSEMLNKRVQKKKRRERLIAFILYELSWSLVPFVGMVIGSAILQAFWGQYSLVKVIWILTAIVGAFTVWGVIADVRAEMSE